MSARGCGAGDGPVRAARTRGAWRARVLRVLEVAPRAALLLGALLAAAPRARACPSCAVGQGFETLGYVLAFMGVPYLVVMGTVVAMRHALREEREV